MIAEKLDLKINEIRDPNTRLKFIESGFTKNQLIELRKLLHLNAEKFAQLLGASVKTIQRIDQNSKTNTNISESVMDIIEIYETGLELYKTPDDVTEFLENEIPFLENKKPLDLCRTSTGRRVVYNYLNQIKYGIMS